MKKTHYTNVSKEFIEYYRTRYHEIFEIPAKVEWGKDIKLLNSLQKTYNDLSVFNCETPLEFLKKACEKYFVINDNLALKSAWSIGVFYYNFGKLALLLKNSDKEVIDPIIDGYKLAYLNHTGNKCEEIFIGKEEIFGHIYLIIKPFWIKYEKYFSFKRFAELYFLVLMVYNDKSQLDFFVSKFAQDKFKNWLETEGKEILMFYPKEIGLASKEKLEVEQKKMLEAEKVLLHLRK